MSKRDRGVVGCTSMLAVAVAALAVVGCQGDGATAPEGTGGMGHSVVGGGAAAPEGTGGTGHSLVDECRFYVDDPLLDTTGSWLLANQGRDTGLMTTTASYVHWSPGSSVWKMPKGGGQAVEIRHADYEFLLGGGDVLYAGLRSSVDVLDPDTGDVIETLDMPGSFLFLEGDSLYGVPHFKGAIHVADRKQGTVTEVWERSAISSLQIAVVDGVIFDLEYVDGYNSPQTLRRNDGGTVTTLAVDTFIGGYSLAVLGKYVYSILEDEDDYLLVRVPEAGGQPELLYRSCRPLGSLYVHDGSVHVMGESNLGRWTGSGMVWFDMTPLYPKGGSRITFDGDTMYFMAWEFGGEGDDFYPDLFTAPIP